MLLFNSPQPKLGHRNRTSRKMRGLCARMMLCLASCSGLRLDAWSRLPDGRVTGTLGDRTVWLNLASRSRAAAAGAHAGEVCRG